MSLVDGQEAQTVALDDRGLLYGDGLFETLYWDGERAPLLARHLARLAAGAARLGIAAPATATWQADIATLAPRSAPAVLRLTLTRGSGGRGYAPARPAQPRRIVTRHTVPPATPAAGVAVRLCTTRLAANPVLAGLKHLNRLEQVLARAEWQDEAIAEGLMFDAEDRLVCGTRSNLVLVLAGEAITPPVTRAGVAGIARGLLLERGLVTEREVRRADLERVDEMLLTNAVRGAEPVCSLEGRMLRPGLLSTAVMRCLREAGLPC